LKVTIGLLVTACVAAFLVLAVGLTITVVALFGDRGPGPAERAAAAAPVLAHAADALWQQPGSRYQGWVVNEDGERIQITDARLTPTGSTLATLTVGGQQAQLLAVGDRTFIKAGEAFWRGNGVPKDVLKQYGTEWVKTDTATLGVDLARLLSPGGISADLAWAAEQVDLRPGAVTSIDGTRVQALVSRAVTVYVTTTEPRRIVRISSAPPSDMAGHQDEFRTSGLDHGPGSPMSPGRMVPVRAPGEPGGFEFDVSGLTEDEVTELYRELEERVRQLKNAIDADVRFSLDGSITLAPCTRAGCVANVRLKNRVTSASPYLYVKKPVHAHITIVMTLDGRPLRTCTATRTMPPNGSTGRCGIEDYFSPSAFDLFESSVVG